MIDQRIAQADPQMRVGRIAADGVLKDSYRQLGIACSRHSLGKEQPMLLRREIPKEGVPCAGERKHFGPCAASR